jgi:hypothetical protein
MFRLSQRASAKLRVGSLDSQSGIRKGGNSGIIIDSGQPERSLLLKAIDIRINL